MIKLSVFDIKSDWYKLNKRNNVHNTDASMDVHYLPHLNRDSKPAKEYFIEFLLIFTAVSLGYFAENLWEQNEDKNKAREYAQSLTDDLKVDTAVIQHLLKEKVWIGAKFDSTENILASPDLLKYNEFIYYVERYLSQNDVFTPNDVTYQHLKSSGKFSYINNNQLYKKIASYYNLCKLYQAIDASFGSVDKNEFVELESRLFNPRDLTSLDNENVSTFYNRIKRPIEKLKPVRRDVDQLKYLYMKIHYSKMRIIETNVYLNQLKSNAVDIIKDLREEYQLE